MNVIISNKQSEQLSNLDIDIIKSISGLYDAFEIVEMFKNFFFNMMILDVTALKNNNDIRSYEVLTKGIDPERIIFLLPDGSQLTTPNFLSHLISLKIYNFTTNVNGIKYLIKKRNTLKDVEQIIKIANMNDSNDTGAAITSIENKKSKIMHILGIKNVTEEAGATTFTYLLKKELSLIYGKNNIVAVEIGKNDFDLFNEKNMFSIREANVNNFLFKYTDTKVILVDLNNCKDDSFCNDIIYLIEPSTIKLNSLVRKNRYIFTKLVNKKVVLNKSLLLNNDIYDFESEAGIKIFYNMPPLDERKRNSIIHDFLSNLGYFVDEHENNNSSTIFGLFRR